MPNTEPSKPVNWATFWLEIERKDAERQRTQSGQTLTLLRPTLAQASARVRPMPEAATVLQFPTDRSEAPAVRLALASILATSRPTQLDTARCGVNMRRAAAGLQVLPPREGAPSPTKAIEELQRACEACGGCRGI
jgi:hypothetical protein